MLKEDNLDNQEIDLGNVPNFKRRCKDIFNISLIFLENKEILVGIGGVGVMIFLTTIFNYF